MGAIIDFDDLGRLRTDLPGKKIVLGTGCFDLLHVGHLYFLQEARRQGDVLIVGLNSDKAIKAIKGPDRPIFKQEERVEMIAAFECVDMAFIFDDVVADSSIRALKPDVFVIGEESVAAYPSELSSAHSAGARVEVVTRIPGVSTTSVLANAHKNRA